MGGSPATVSGARLACTAQSFGTHVAKHNLAEPVSVSITWHEWGQLFVSVQVPHGTPTEVAARLTAWADTLRDARAEAWLPPDGDKVILSVHGTLGDPQGAVTVKVYGCVDYGRSWFPELKSHPFEGAPVPVEMLRRWAVRNSAAPANRTAGVVE